MCFITFGRGLHCHNKSPCTNVVVVAKVSECCQVCTLLVQWWQPQTSSGVKSTCGVTVNSTEGASIELLLATASYSTEAKRNQIGTLPVLIYMEPVLIAIPSF